MTMKYDYTGFKELYENGMSDTEISKKLYIPVKNITSYRRLKSLPSNRAWKKYDYSGFRKLYNRGMSDADIGAALGIPAHNVVCHRLYLKLPVNNVKIKYNYTEAKKLYDRGYKDADICKILEMPTGAFHQWRKNRNLPANRPPRSVVSRHYWKDLSKMINETDKDKDSLFCDGDFLEHLLQKPIERLRKESENP